MSSDYDMIGVNYDQLRRPDPRIAAQIHRHLGNAQSILNIGAGTGSYEPQGRAVTAVEPSAAMIAKRSPDAALAVQGSAESLPFADNSFDAAMAILTVHHWHDKAAGLAEMRRVARGPVVLLTFDPDARPWLTDYFPELVTLDDGQMPRLDYYACWLGPVMVLPVPVPQDCTDGFLYAYWARPHAYLDARVRSGSSSFWRISDLEAGLKRLADDLASGAWEQRYGWLREYDALDVGYRLVIAA